MHYCICCSDMSMDGSTPTFFEDEILLPIGLLAANSLVYSLVVFFFFFALRGRFHFLTYLIHVIIPELGR